MSKLKNLYILPLVLLTSLLLAACTHDEQPEAEGEDSGTRVRVINDESDEDTAADDDTEEAESPDQTDTEKEDDSTETDEEEEVEDSEPVISPDGMQEINGATASDNVVLSTYGYGTVGGKLIFGFVSDGSTGLPYAKATAGFDQNGDLVVTFPSLKADYLRSSLQSPVVLGGSLPELVIEEVSGGSRYIFKFGQEKEFTLKGNAETSETIIEVRL